MKKLSTNGRLYDIETIFDTFKLIFADLFEEREFDAALRASTAMREFFAAVSYDDRAGDLLKFAKLAVMYLETNSEAANGSEPACSFCGKRPPTVNLGAGPGCFICSECVETFGKIFETQ